MSDDDHYRVAIVHVDGERIVVAAGEIDLAARDRLWGTIVEAGLGDRRLVVDMSQTTFIDSIGLTVLLRALQVQRKAGLGMVLRSPSPAVLRTLEMTGLVDDLTVDADEDPPSDQETPA